jgi:hypothetical protein
LPLSGLEAGRALEATGFNTTRYASGLIAGDARFIDIKTHSEFSRCPSIRKLRSKVSVRRHDRKSIGHCAVFGCAVLAGKVQLLKD